MSTTKVNNEFETAGNVGKRVAASFTAYLATISAEERRVLCQALLSTNEDAVQADALMAQFPITVGDIVHLAKFVGAVAGHYYGGGTMEGQPGWDDV